ncbi:unnamed protein product [Adineta steineri]|uniref:G-protein coupled receptors family 1 profile domain-containing protein n=1 Tax=Adineta steineri TaxID=433720 RepID=A0A815KS30_9BILA|nr:unnamed protein product [Adineta steineri]CAF1613676.1 unnamed protein product [Adineta steineri]
MLNNSFNQNVTKFSIGINLIAILSSSLGILFNFILIIILIHYGKFTKHSNKNNSRRIGLVHSINTYIHLIGILSTLLLMCIQTFYSDLYGKKYDENFIPWHCHILAYLMTSFAAGVYGSCFLQALFRFWRITKSSRSRFQKLPFHIQLIFTHWIFIMLLLLPTLPRTIYISSDHFCLTPFDDRLTAAYTSIITAIIPVIGISIIYIKIIFYIKHHSQAKKRWKHIKRDVLIIRRILFLVIIILQTSSAGIILWILTFFDKRLHPYFYRLLRFIIILCMIICSMALLIVSPQLKRALRSKNPNDQSRSYTKKPNTSSNNMEEIAPFETLTTL